MNGRFDLHDTCKYIIDIDEMFRFTERSEVKLQGQICISVKKTLLWLQIISVWFTFSVRFTLHVTVTNIYTRYS